MTRQDLVFAVRMLRKAPGFTLAAVLATALGIGANTAIFTVVKQVLLQPLPFRDPARIVNVDEMVRGRSAAISPPNFRDWKAQNRTLEALGGYNEQPLTLTGAFEALRLEGVAIDRAGAAGARRCSRCSAAASPKTTRARGRGRWCCSATASGGASTAATPASSGARSRSKARATK